MPILVTSYAGADWVARGPWKGKTMSPLGHAVADVLGVVYRGIYHLQPAAIDACDWSSIYRVRIAVLSDLCTYDGDELTRLVVLCHDMLLRLEVAPAGPQRLGLSFFQRARRTAGSIGERMPTLEDHAAMIRRDYTITEDAAP